jgi:hypothetical protein
LTICASFEGLLVCGRAVGLGLEPLLYPARIGSYIGWKRLHAPTVAGGPNLHRNCSLSRPQKNFPERVTSVAVEANLQGGAVGLAIDLSGRPSLGHLSTDGGVIETIYARKVTL